MEALGQCVDQEPADELMCVERHCLVAAGSLDPVVLTLNVTALSSTATRRRFEIATRWV